MSLTYYQALVTVQNQIADPRATSWGWFGLYLAMCDSLRDAWPDFCEQTRDETYSKYGTPANRAMSMAVPSWFLASSTAERPYGKIDSIWFKLLKETYYLFSGADVGDLITITGTTAPANGTLVRLYPYAGASLPAGLSADTDYYVISATGSTFQLATTSGGSAIPITANGSGQINIAYSANYDSETRLRKGVALDPLNQTTPFIRFKRGDFTRYQYVIYGRRPFTIPSVYFYSATAASPGVFTATGGYTLTNGDRVAFSEAGLPGGIGKSIAYYVVNSAGATFQVALTAGGTAINTTSTGTGNFVLLTGNLTASDIPGFMTYLRWDMEAKLRSQKQKSGEYDTKAQGQRRLLAEQWARNQLSRYFIKPYYETFYTDY